MSKLLGNFNPFAIFSLLVTSWHLNCFPWLHFKIFFILSKFWLPQKENIKLSRIFFHLWVNFDVMNFPTQNQNHELSERIFNCRHWMKVKRTLNSCFVFVFTDKIRSSFLKVTFQWKRKELLSVILKMLSQSWESRINVRINLNYTGTVLQDCSKYFLDNQVCALHVWMFASES